MKVRFFPDGLLVGLVLLGALAIADEAWTGPAPAWLINFLIAHNLWHIWNQLRWQFMYSHELLHFLSGVFGSLLGCWIYFAFQKRKASSSSITREEQNRLP